MAHAWKTVYPICPTMSQSSAPSISATVQEAVNTCPGPIGRDRPRGVHSKGPLFLRGMMSIADLMTLRLDCPTTCAMCDVTPLPVPPDDKRCLPRHPSCKGGPSFLYIPQALCSPIPSPKISPYQSSTLSSPPSNGSSYCLTPIAPPTRM